MRLVGLVALFLLALVGFQDLAIQQLMVDQIRWPTIDLILGLTAIPVALFTAQAAKSARIALGVVLLGGLLVTAGACLALSGAISGDDYLSPELTLGGFLLMTTANATAVVQTLADKYGHRS